VLVVTEGKGWVQMEGEAARSVKAVMSYGPHLGSSTGMAPLQPAR